MNFNKAEFYPWAGCIHLIKPDHFGSKLQFFDLIKGHDVPPMPFAAIFKCCKTG